MREPIMDLNLISSFDSNSDCVHVVEQSAVHHHCSTDRPILQLQELTWNVIYEYCKYMFGNCFDKI